MNLLNVGTRALLANQTALQTVGHNISNVNTPGYSRQTVVQQAAQGQFTGNGYIGNGVNLLTIQRSHNELLTRQSTAADAVKASDAVRANRMREVQDIFSGGPEGLGASVNSMMNSLADVVSAPTDITARTVFLTRMDETALRMNSAAEQLDAVESSVSEGLQNGVDQINAIAPQIATLNGLIAKAKGSSQAPNDLLDQRDQLIRDLNQHIQTSQIDATDGSVSLFVAGSQPLVLGNAASTLRVADSKAFAGGTGNKTLYFRQAGSSVDIELTQTMLGGGEVAGLIKFQNGELTEARNLLGRMAVAIGQTLNAQNQNGLTLDGNAGLPLLSQPEIEFPAGSGTFLEGVRGHTASRDVTDGAALFKDPAKFVASDYQVSLTSVTGTPPTANGTITRLSDGTVMKDANGNTNIDLSQRPEFDGLEFVVNGGKAGDQILFKPFAKAASDIQALVGSPRELAAANPINAQMGVENTGSLKLTSLRATGQIALPSTGNPVTMTFQSGPPATYAATISNPDPTQGPISVQTGPYVSGAEIAIGDWQITLQGHPADGDTVKVGNAKDFTTNGDGWYQRDAGNARAMMDLRDVPLFDGAALSDGYADLMSKLGVRTQTATFAAELSGSISSGLNRQRSAISGVNLDEEAAKLLQYQQAYQAAAKAIQVAQSVFSDLLQAVGR